MSLLRRVIGAVLRRVRLRQRRTLREVAQQAGVSLAYLSEIERGRKEASSEVLAAICDALGLRLVDLLEEAREELIRIEPAISPLLPRRPGGVPVPPGALAPPRPNPLAGQRPPNVVTGQRPPNVVVGRRAVALARRHPGGGPAAPRTGSAASSGCPNRPTGCRRISSMIRSAGGPRSSSSAR